MPNPCGQVHMPSFPCRECDRVRAMEKIDVVEVQAPRQSADQTVSDEGPVDVGVEQGSPPARLAVAREPLSNAERCRRWRAKDPEKVRERDRMRKAAKRGE